MTNINNVGVVSTVSLFDAMQNGTRTTNGMPAFKSTNRSTMEGSTRLCARF